MDPKWVTQYAFPVFLVLIGVEALWYLTIRRKPYAWRESATSLVIAVGYKLAQFLIPLTAGVLYGLAYEHRLWTVPTDTWWGLGLLFFGVEFSYYWFHRLSHEVRWLWATHSVHHSPQQMNLTAAYRLGWTGILSCNFIFWIPLMVVGFSPIAVLGMFSINLLYQFWLHTETIPKLKYFEWFFNSPSHHRVHHATNPNYLDRNYGGVVIIFDRLFGTFASEQDHDPCRYGLVKQIDSLNPVRIAFNEWLGILRDMIAAPNLRARVFYAFGPPGWSHDGSRQTSAMIRTRAEILPASSD